MAHLGAVEVHLCETDEAHLTEFMRLTLALEALSGAMEASKQIDVSGTSTDMLKAQMCRTDKLTMWQVYLWQPKHNNKIFYQTDCYIT